MRLHPHLNFGGQCREAFHFYERCRLGNVETMLTWGDSPMANDVPREWHDKICHATLRIGAAYQLAGVDDPFEKYAQPAGFQLLLEIDDAQEAESRFSALAENGTVILPIQKTFWAVRYGIVVDPFGLRWEISSGQAFI